MNELEQLNERIGQLTKLVETESKAIELMKTALEAAEKKNGTSLRKPNRVDPMTAPAAHWDINCDGYYPFCSNCGESAAKMSRYCPNCGAKMITRGRGT